jgi:hypothetical protein
LLEQSEYQRPPDVVSPDCARPPLAQARQRLAPRPPQGVLQTPSVVSWKSVLVVQVCVGPHDVPSVLHSL